MVDRLRTRTTLVAVVLLVACSAAWGSTFVVMKGAVSHAPVPEFLGWRFLVASFLLVAMRPGAVVRLGWRGWGRGAALGCVLAAGYLTQTYGLEHTSAAVSGFLTGLQVVFTPFLMWALLRQRPGSRTWTASLVASCGLAVITLHGLSVGIGDVLTISCAVLFALQIVGIGRWVSAKDAYGLATVQVLTVGVISVIIQSPRGVGLPATGGECSAVVVTAVAATAFAFVAQSWAQTRLSAITASLVFALEPVFAAVFAWADGEPIGWSVLLGGGLVVASIVVIGLGSDSSRVEPAETLAPAGLPPRRTVVLAIRPVLAERAGPARETRAFIPDAPH
jgi:drug/metabolite transporter (DMT)-like permease